jgi:ParB-like chromosome segregation protein Spo0J
MRKSAYTARDRKDALIEAELQLTTKGRPSTEPAFVELLVHQIKLQPELFQPREFSYGFREVDKDHVKKLKRAIDIVGELDPIVVVKLGRKWVCVDGHHRLEAYRAVNWQGQIKCEWFSGTVREAMDESMSRNKKDRLNVPQADRLEEAWKRVLLGGWSKSEIVKLCGVGDGTVAFMRRVVGAYQDDDKFAREFKRRLARPLNETSWSMARLAFNGVEPKEINDETEAAKLARRINARLTNLLSRDPAVTARALRLYDPELPEQLIEAWSKPSRASEIADELDAG